MNNIHNYDDKEKKDWTKGPHVFIPPGPTDSRSPCPALNALANHSIIPHSGRQLSFHQIFTSIRSVYNLSTALAFILTLAGFILCGTGSLFTLARFHNKLDLHDLARHGKIEHDASLVHDDTPKDSIWAPVEVDERLLDELLVVKGKDKEAPLDKRDGLAASGLDLHDFAAARLRRDLTLAKPLSRFLNTMARGESAFTLLTLGNKEGYVNKELLKVWFGEDRLPEGWSGNVTGWKVGLRRLNTVAKRIGKVEGELRKAKGLD